MPYKATRQHVHNRGRAPESFLDELVTWGRAAPDEIFAPNSASDIYSSVRNTLGPWESAQHRRAVMLEVLRVLGGFESSWRWDEGIDESNEDSDTQVEFEAGIFQVSANSMNRVEGWYEKYTDAQEQALKSVRQWLRSKQPSVFSYDLVLGHDEVSPGRKNDPGGALSMSMPAFRAWLKSNA